ncbi:MAG TPA: sugar phosphate isomerase/epimerase [Gemmataceae bacterium]|nr:sugar phosphate isomerase/epimerase [Gemmataceae bacterium]
MYVACSTLCFARQSFEEALRGIAELQFTKFEAALHESGPHLRPSQIASDVHDAAERLRYGPGLAPAAFSVEIEAPDDADYMQQFAAVCRLARISAVPLLTLTAAPAHTAVEAEIRRLTRLTALADKEGVQATVATRIGTLTEDPDAAVLLCQRVPGLGLTLDPSHYIAGPNAGKGFDQVFPYVRHVQLRDTGRGANQFQVRVGQGEVEYGRIVSQLERCSYDRLLSVDIRDTADAPFTMQPEVRKLKYLLESLV